MPDNKTARWQKDETTDRHTCSACHNPALYYARQENLTKFCPHCGAAMQANKPEISEMNIEELLFLSKQLESENPFKLEIMQELLHAAKARHKLTKPVMSDEQAVEIIRGEINAQFTKLCIELYDGLKQKSLLAWKSKPTFRPEVDIITGQQTGDIFNYAVVPHMNANQTSELTDHLILDTFATLYEAQAYILGKHYKCVNSPDRQEPESTEQLAENLLKSLRENQKIGRFWSDDMLLTKNNGQGETISVQIKPFDCTTLPPEQKFTACVHIITATAHNQEIYTSEQKDTPVESIEHMLDYIIRKHVFENIKFRIPTTNEWDTLKQNYPKDISDDMAFWCIKSPAGMSNEIHGIAIGGLDETILKRVPKPSPNNMLGLRPVIKATRNQKELKDGSAVIMGTLYIDDEPVNTENTAITCNEYKQGTRITIKEPLDDSRYQIIGIKLNNIIIAKDVILKNITWHDIKHHGITYFA